MFAWDTLVGRGMKSTAHLEATGEQFEFKFHAVMFVEQSETKTLQYAVVVSQRDVGLHWSTAQQSRFKMGDKEQKRPMGQASWPEISTRD